MLNATPPQKPKQMLPVSKAQKEAERLKIESMTDTEKSNYYAHKEQQRLEREEQKRVYERYQATQLIRSMQEQEHKKEQERIRNEALRLERKRVEEENRRIEELAEATRKLRIETERAEKAKRKEERNALRAEKQKAEEEKVKKDKHEEKDAERSFMYHVILLRKAMEEKTKERNALDRVLSLARQQHMTSEEMTAEYKRLVKLFDQRKVSIPSSIKLKNLPTFHLDPMPVQYEKWVRTMIGLLGELRKVPATHLARYVTLLQNQKYLLVTNKKTIEDQLLRLSSIPLNQWTTEDHEEWKAIHYYVEKDHEEYRQEYKTMKSVAMEFQAQVAHYDHLIQEMQKEVAPKE